MLLDITKHGIFDAYIAILNKFSLSNRHDEPREQILETKELVSYLNSFDTIFDIV